MVDTKISEFNQIFTDLAKNLEGTPFDKHGCAVPINPMEAKAALWELLSLRGYNERSEPHELVAGIRAVKDDFRL